MPCRDYYDDNPAAYYGPILKDKDAEIAKLRRQISFAESALCGVLRAADAQEADSFKGPVWGYIDFPESGITSDELEKWFVKHKEADARSRELARLEFMRFSKIIQDIAVDAADRKLTPDETDRIREICKEPKFAGKLATHIGSLSKEAMMLIIEVKMASE